MGKCCVTTTSLFIILLNGTLFLAAAVTAGIGFWAYYGDGSALSDLGISLANMAIALIVVGTAVASICFFACCGACCGSRVLLGLYMLLLWLLIAVQISVGIYILLNRDEIPTLLADAWSSASDDTRYSIEDQFDCCGFTGPLDQPGGQCDPSWTEGCQEKLESTLEQNSLAVGICCLALVAFQIVAFICPCILCINLSKKNKYKALEGYHE
ncbi:Tetraspanin family [Pelomyxa schiedti]|nr:Tetraspanin family [Pelomyxa schiedti]